MSEKSANEGDNQPKDNTSNNETSPSPKEESNTVTPDDLIELIRAVKFKSPDASIRETHTEITSKMSQTENFEFLQHVELNDVKKVWKKAVSVKTLPDEGNVKQESSTPTSTTANTSSTTPKVETSPNETKSDTNLIADNVPKDGIIKFYTVGNGSVQTLAKNYTMEAAALAVSQKQTQKDGEDDVEYVHCFLDVPADRSGKKPHQALINFNDNTQKSLGKKKKNKKHGTPTKTTEGEDKREIVKIQYAAPIPGHDEKLPMLLYNADRLMKTFIHPGDDDGYDRIKDIIMSDGTKGALAGGGSKAYFYGRVTRRKRHEQDIISIDVSSGLAPQQTW